MTLDRHTSDPEGDFKYTGWFFGYADEKGSIDTGAAGQAGRSAVKTEDL